MEKVKEIKNFCNLTDEEWKSVMEEDEKKRKEGKCKSLEEVLMHWKERYGIEI